MYQGADFFEDLGQALGLRQQMQDHEARRTETARMEMRIYELEAALRTLSAKGEQVVRDTGDAMKSMVQNSSAAVLQQLQLNVNALSTQAQILKSPLYIATLYRKCTETVTFENVFSTQMKVVEQELLLRGSEIAHRTEEEGKQRQRSLAELERMISAQLQRVESEVTVCVWGGGGVACIYVCIYVYVYVYIYIYIYINI